MGSKYLIQRMAVPDPFGDCSLGSSRAHVLRLALQLCLPLRVGSLQLLSQVLHPCEPLSEPDADMDIGMTPHLKVQIAVSRQPAAPQPDATPAKTGRW